MPHYSVIIPAYNEATWLPKSLSALKVAMAAIEHTGEVIVADNNSSDDTSQVAKAHGAKVVFEAKNQISRARNAGARAATGKYLIFLDADCLISPQLLKTALACLETGTCCGGGTLIRFDRETGLFSRLILHFWIGVSKRFKLAAGSFIYCLREAFEEIGGFSTNLYAGEEIRFSQDLKRWGKRKKMRFLIIADQAITTSARKLDHPLRVAWTTALCLLFPFAIFFRSLCGYWYKRPEEKPPNKEEQTQ